MGTDSRHISEEQLSSRIDGELAAEDARAVNAHLEICESCRLAADEMAEIDRFLRSAEVPEVPSRVWHRVSEHLDEGVTGAPLPRLFGWLGLGSLSPGVAKSLAWSTAVTLLLAAVFVQQWSARRTEVVRLAEIDRAHSVMIAQFSESDNPFRPAGAAGGRDENPFNFHHMNRDINPFQASMAR